MFLGLSQESFKRSFINELLDVSEEKIKGASFKASYFETVGTFYKKSFQKGFIIGKFVNILLIKSRDLDKTL